MIFARCERNSIKHEKPPLSRKRQGERFLKRERRRRRKGRPAERRDENLEPPMNTDERRWKNGLLSRRNSPLPSPHHPILPSLFFPAPSPPIRILQLLSRANRYRI